MNIRVENVGGITRADLSLSPGVTVLVGPNATNRTSFLQAVMAVFGSEKASLRGNADEGRIELNLNERTFARTLSREGDSVRFGGDSYLDDSTLADLFAFLLESNEARRAIQYGENLRDLLLEPVDADAIERQIDQLSERRDQLEAKLEDVEELRASTLPQLEQRLADIEAEAAAKREELAETEEQLGALDVEVDETKSEKRKLEGKFEELRETRNELDTVRHRIESKKESIETLRDDREALESELADLPDSARVDQPEIEQRIEELRSQRSHVETEFHKLQGIVQFNEEMMQGDGAVSSLFDGNSAESNNVTDQLLDASALECWTCGTAVPESQVEEMLETLREMRSSKLKSLNRVEAELDDVRERRDEIEEREHRRDCLERKLEQIDSEITERTETVDDLEERTETLEGRIGTLEDEATALEDEAYSEILALHSEANQLEFELGRLEQEKEEVKNELRDVETQIGDTGRIEAQIEDIRSELVDLRTHITQLEKQAVEEFNEHMDTILNLLGYENIDRIWIERKEIETREGRQTVQKTLFDLHIVRRNEEGVLYEDTVEHLSESEREVTGLIFGLAGYLVHDVNDVLPVMLLDSLEALDSNRISVLIDYIQEYVDFLIVALLPEDAAAVDDEFDYVPDLG